MPPLHWTVKSTRNLAAPLTHRVHRLSADTVEDLLREEDFSLQPGAKTLEGKQHPDHDAQFHHINERAMCLPFSTPIAFTASPTASNTRSGRAKRASRRPK